MTASAASEAPDPDVTYDLDDRDPDYIRETLPTLWLYASVWHRAEVRGLDQVPPDGPVLLVGNHSGGITPPDAPVFAVAFASWFGVERPIFLLTHDMLFRLPVVNQLRKWGMMPASRANTRMALRTATSCSSSPAATSTCTGRRRSRPPSTSGAQGLHRRRPRSRRPGWSPWCRSAPRRASSSSAGERLAKLVRLDRLFRAKIYPRRSAFPSASASAGSPSTCRSPPRSPPRCSSPSTCASASGPNPDRTEVYDHVMAVMQEAMDALAAERRYPVLG